MICACKTHKDTPGSIHEYGCPALLYFVTTKLPPNPKQAYGDLKVPLGLVPSTATILMGEAFKEGARKYGAYNWRQQPVESMTYIHATLRHVAAYIDGEEIDPESGKPHLAHALACLAIIVDAAAVGCLLDNRPPHGVAGELLRAKAEAPTPPAAAMSTDHGEPPVSETDYERGLADALAAIRRR